MDLEGQIALVTGGGRGLGRAYAVALARAGAAVAVTARSKEQVDETAALIAEAGGRALAVAADVTDRRAVERLADQVERELGAISLLVNSAGVLLALGPLAELDPDEWWREVEVNLRGPLLCTRAVLPGMIARRQGRIINLASSAGLFAIETVSAYCVGKAALVRLTESVAIEAAAHGVFAFAIDPGTVRTPMTEHAMRSELIGRRAPMVQRTFREFDAGNLFVPVERSVQLVLDLASGKADSLSGRFLRAEDDLDALIALVAGAPDEDQHRLRLHM